MPPFSIDQPLSGGYEPSAISDSLARPTVHVTSDNIAYHDDHILSKYVYENAIVSKELGKFVVKPTKTQYEFKTETNLPRIG